MKKLSLLFIFLSLFVLVIAFSSCADDPISTPQTTTTHTITEDPPKITTTAPITTTPPVVKNPPSIPYAEDTVSYLGYVKVPSESYISGTLLNIGTDHPYQYNVPSLVPNSQLKDYTTKIPSQNLMILYGNKSKTYLLKSSKLFIKTDAFPYLEAMMNQFAEDSGITTAQLVNSYLYSDPTTLVSEYVTGYSIAMNILREGATYSLTSPELSFTYHDKTVTCLDWFIENCASYGFIYTGLSGSQALTLATFRFVGIPHALTMDKYDLIDVAVYLRMIKENNEPHISIVNEATGEKWIMFYQEAHSTNDNTVIEIPFGAKYTISGDNVGGFVVAYSLLKE